MCVSREGGMFWIHDNIQSTAFDETLLYCHCFDPAKLRDDQFAAWKAAWKPEPETGRKKFSIHILPASTNMEQSEWTAIEIKLFEKAVRERGRMADSIGYIRVLPATPECGCGIS